MKKSIIVMVMGLVVMVRGLEAQTTLSGDHVITGDLNVGTSGTEGNLTVTGETGTVAQPSLKVTGDGGVVFEGQTGNGGFPAFGDGPLFFWYPKKEALVMREADHGLQDSHIGKNSIAMGLYSKAQGESSLGLVGGMAQGLYNVAIGTSSQTSGVLAVAIGAGATSSDESIAMGAGSLAEGIGGTAVGLYSVGSGGVAIGYDSLASGDNSTALGPCTIAIGDYSMALGLEASAVGSYSLAIGKANAISGTGASHFPSIAIGFESNAQNGGISFGNYASSIGMNSLAFGGYARTEGEFSVAIGMATTVAMGSVAMGRYNVLEGVAYDWVETDPLFVIGNGTGLSSDPPEVRNRNALTLRKNGDLELIGKVSMPRQGDILMGEFGNPE